MNDGSDDQGMGPGDPWLYQMQMLEYQASHDEATGGRSEFSSIIVGTQYHDKATYDSLQQGDRLRLVREPDNEHDHNAIAVLTIEGRKLGYVPRNDASLIAEKIDTLELLEVYATYRNGRIYLDFGLRSPDHVSNDEHDQTLVELDQLDDFQVR